MSNIDLKAIRARLKRAIGGPWTLGRAPGGPPVVYGPGEYGAVAVIGTGTINGAHSVAEILGNAELVANAPADLAALLAAVEAMRHTFADVLERLEGVVRMRISTARRMSA
jgi:hypothetical protein